MMKEALKSMKNYATRSEILLDQYLITQTNMMKNIEKLNLIQMIIYLRNCYPQDFLEGCLYKL